MQTFPYLLIVISFLLLLLLACTIPLLTKRLTSRFPEFTASFFHWFSNVSSSSRHRLRGRDAAASLSPDST